MQIVFHAIAEDQAGRKWRNVYDRHWRAYSRWFLREGNRARPTYLASVRALRAHMPELIPAFEQVCEAAGGGDLEARFLSMWCPPIYVGGCSQAILGRSPSCIIRNYDFSPHLIEGTWLASRFIGRRVLAMLDCLWGVLDGINEDGLSVSLAFGGRTVVGEGFGIPIVLRYLLECAHTVAEAVAILKRVPVHMSYTVAILDGLGEHATVYVGPDHVAEIVPRRVTTNHQHKVEWARHAAATSSVERSQALERAMRRARKPQDVLSTFLKPPVYQTNYELGYGTLYTALYRPDIASAELIWPAARWTQSCDHFQEGARTVTFPCNERTGDQDVIQELMPAFRVSKRWQQ
jgi:predicted choloylglycine hydrolase